MDPQPGPPHQDPLIGRTIGNYLVTQKLGEGGMGSVYLAEHPTIGKKVALKVLHAEYSTNEDVARRFFDEAKAVNNINHPNIVDIVDYGVLEGGRERLVYFIMEYLMGGTLSDLLRAEAPLPPERALGIAMQVGDALSASHQCGIVHRDLKPDNIILQQRGRERDFVKLLDFGIAKLTADGAESRTRTGIVMGTPAYMSPEQCEGKANVDARTDIYALGIVLYEMLTGRVPFIGEGYGEILVQHLTQNPVPLSSYRMLPPHVEIVVLKALEKRMEMRYPTMDEMMRAMSDPVGYVEAHGGTAQFLQRQLMPSTAPISMPSMLRAAPSSAQYTPAPGTLQAPSGIYTPATAQSPTTLGASVGEAQRKPNKTGFVVAALAILVGAGIAIAVVLSAGKGNGSKAAGSGTAGSQMPDAAVVAAAIDAALVTSVDAAPLTVADAAVTMDAATVETEVKLTFTGKPVGAAILIDGKDTGVKTPGHVVVPKSDTPVIVTFKLSGFDDPGREVTPSADSTIAYTLKKKPGKTATTHTGKTTPTPTGNVNDTKLERPD